LFIFCVIVINKAGLLLLLAQLFVCVCDKSKWNHKNWDETTSKFCGCEINSSGEWTLKNKKSAFVVAAGFLTLVLLFLLLLLWTVNKCLIVECKWRWHVCFFVLFFWMCGQQTLKCFCHFLG